MVIQIFDNKEQVAKAGATLIAAQLIDEPESVLGFATGSSPVGIYQELIKLYEAGVITFAATTSFNLDEYVGLDKKHEQSYFHFMQEHLFSKINLNPENIHIPDGMAEDLDEECERYESLLLQAGGIDLQLLGIGRNGHIGFNEPAAVMERFTHTVDLEASTIEANARFFSSADEVPRRALSMGISTIMEAGKIVLIATGEDKAEAVRAMIQGPISASCPASVLQLHPAVTVLLDQESASLL